MSGRARWGAGVLLLTVLTSCAGPAEPDPAGPGATGGAPWPAGRFDYQIGGAYPPAAGVTVVVRDRRDPPAGAYPVCYLNAYQTQPEDTAWWRREHPDLVLPVEDPDWPGEFLLDTTRPAALLAVVGPWIDGCAAAGYRAVEPDNLDSWTRSGGRVTEADALAYARLLVGRAHARGLAVAQKNAAELGGRGRAAGFDFAVTEDCAAERECAAYTGVYGAAVLEVEYTDAGFAAACPAGHPVVLRDRDVLPAGSPGHRNRTC